MSLAKHCQRFCFAVDNLFFCPYYRNESKLKGGDFLKFLLRDMLDARGVTAYQLAKALGVTQPSVGAWLNGRTRAGNWSPVYPEYEALERICAFLECRLDEILIFDAIAEGPSYRDFRDLAAA
jgi:DNA-binding Xre family transcriptional regulator